MRHSRWTALALVAWIALAGGARAQTNDDLKSLPGYVDFAALDRIGTEAKVEVNLKGPMLQMVSKFLEDDPEVGDLMTNLRFLRVRVYDLTEEIDKAFLAAGSETMVRLDKGGWERIVRVREKNERVDIYFKPSAKAEWIDGVLIIAVDTEAVFVNIVGTIRPEDVGRIGKHFDLDGLDIAPDGDTRIRVESKKKTKPGAD